MSGFLLPDLQRMTLGLLLTCLAILAVLLRLAWRLNISDGVLVIKKFVFFILTMHIAISDCKRRCCDGFVLGMELGQTLLRFTFSGCATFATNAVGGSSVLWGVQFWTFGLGTNEWLIYLVNDFEVLLGCLLSLFVVLGLDSQLWFRHGLRSPSAKICRSLGLISLREVCNLALC